MCCGEGEAAAGAACGRPRRGGCATCTSGGDRQGFNLRVEKVSILSPTLKNLSDLSKTRKGPSYAADSGAVWPSLLTSTCLASSNSSGNCCGAGVEWCEVGSTVLPDRIP